MSEQTATSETPDTAIIDTKIEAFGHFINVTWDEKKNVEIWLDGVLVGGVHSVLLGVEVEEDGVLKHTHTITFLDHEVNEEVRPIFAQAGFTVTVKPLPKQS